MIAHHGTAAHVERLVSAMRRVSREEAQEQLAQRKLSWYVESDGSYVIRARLAPEQGERLLRALEAAEEELPLDDTVNGTMRRADALERMADSYLTNGDGDSSGGDRYTVHVHTRVEALEAAAVTEEDISAETSRRAACDCGVVHWLENDRGQALSIGRRSRNITPALRRALKHRDGGCTFPGCTTRNHVDAHHVVHWADGGETKLDNLVLLCRHHHRLVHEGGYEVTLSPSGEKRFRDSNGTSVPPGPDTRFRGNVLALPAAHAEAGLSIDAGTLPPRWQGEPMDLGLAVQALVQRAGTLWGS